MKNTSLAHKTIAAALAASFLLAPAAAFAQSCDAATEARLQFLETRLEEARGNTMLWWGSWLAIFSIGAVYGTTAGALEDNNEIAAANFITASKSVLGIAQLTLRPHVGRHGADAARAIPKDSPANCAERLRVAEQTLESAAEDANMRWSWKRHMASLVLNLGAGVIVAEACDEPGQGWRDFAVSEVSSEAHLWTHPTRATDDWAAYRNQFDGAPLAKDRASLSFAAIPGGVGLVYKF